MKQRWIKRVAIAGIAAIAGFPSVGLTKPSPSRAVPDGNGCFLTTASGQVINLDKWCGGGGNASQPASSATVVPTATQQGVFQTRIKRRLHGIPVIDVTFNNKKTFEMILDTGASGTLITRPMAEALGVNVIGRIQSTIADGSTVVFPVGRVNSISVNGASVQNVEVAIAEQMNLGLLGHDFFGSYDVKIKKDVVEFYRRS